MAVHYNQPALPTTKSGFRINCLDYQILTKSEGWNQDQTKRLNEFQQYKNLLLNPTDCYVALAVPYDNLTKYTNYVTDARSKGFKIWHRSHWNAAEGDNSVGNIATENSLTSSGTTATCVTSTNHGLQTGDTVSINGTNEHNYKGEFTVTVTNATTFTYTMPGTATSPATGNIGWRYGRATIVRKSKQFIIDNSSLYQPGDLYGMNVEPQQLDGSSLTYRDVNYSDGTTTFNYTKYNQFCIDQVGQANDAFDTAGITGVHTWPISFGLSNLDRTGYPLSNDDEGNGSGLTAADINTYFAGRLTIDHYCSSALRDGNAYYTDYSFDVGQIYDWLKTGVTNPQIMVGEWGYHTETATSDGEQHGVYDSVVGFLRTKPYIIGLNFWNHLGQTQSSLWTDTSGTINPGGRRAVASLAKAFNTGNAANGWRVRVS